MFILFPDVHWLCVLQADIGAFSNLLNISDVDVTWQYGPPLI